jgi:hypothetical protein
VFGALAEFAIILKHKRHADLADLLNHHNSLLGVQIKVGPVDPDQLENMYVEPKKQLGFISRLKKKLKNPEHFSHFVDLIAQPFLSASTECTQDLRITLLLLLLLLFADSV